jgi:peptidoglycan/xylan/chitin deacetylase (PgdA/CDA1 family)
MLAAHKALGHRERLARGILRSGGLSMLSALPARDSLLVLTYHRIGDAESDPWDPGVFSATKEEFEQQVAYFKRQGALVTLEEALAFLEGKTKRGSPRCRVLFTFDDGYLDNYQIAFPILRSYGAQGVFFLCSALVGSNYMPWWDHLAYLVKNSSRKQFSLGYPQALDVDIEAKGIDESLFEIFALYKSPENTDSKRFVCELKEAVDGKDVPADARRFLDWDEAREMIAAGMAIGAHTHTHAMLSKLTGDKQREELSFSRAALADGLGIAVDTLAYPFGIQSAFTEETQQIAGECGFRAAFSYYGNIANLPRTINPYNIKRVCVGSQSWARLQVQVGICRISGRFWP